MSNMKIKGIDYEIMRADMQAVFDANKKAWEYACAKYGIGQGWSMFMRKVLRDRTWLGDYIGRDSADKRVLAYDGSYSERFGKYEDSHIVTATSKIMHGLMMELNMDALQACVDAR